MGRWMVGRMNGWMNRWVDGWMSIVVDWSMINR